jgi:hypothetical protein
MLRSRFNVQELVETDSLVGIRVIVSISTSLRVSTTARLLLFGAHKSEPRL